MNRRDMMLIGVLLLLAFVSMFLMYRTQGGGTQVMITQDGELYGTYDLSKNQLIYIETEEGMNTVEIKEGSVSMTEASCPDQICVYSYPLSAKQPGVIVCLPHKIVVKIEE